jgi:hypothetical protein
VGSGAIRRYKSLTILLLGYGITLGNQGCYQMSPDARANKDSDNVQLLGGLSDCQFISVPTFKSLLRNTLSLPQDDTALLDANGRATNNFYLSTFQASLGASVNGSPSDSSCSALKYKLASEIMINACTEAPESTMQRLFPRGSSDFTTLYLTFLGRNPTQDEVQTLRQLKESVSETVAERAACAAVGSSLEVLARNI